MKDYLLKLTGGTVLTRKQLKSIGAGNGTGHGGAGTGSGAGTTYKCQCHTHAGTWYGNYSNEYQINDALMKYCEGGVGTCSSTSSGGGGNGSGGGNGGNGGGD